MTHAFHVRDLVRRAALGLTLSTAGCASASLPEAEGEERAPGSIASGGQWDPSSGAGSEGDDDLVLGTTPSVADGSGSTLTSGECSADMTAEASGPSNPGPPEPPPHEDSGASWTWLVYVVAVRLKIERGRVTVLEDLGEINTGAPSTLSDFIEWGIASFPADRYALGLGDHGGGISGYGVDEASGADTLTMPELVEAFSASELAVSTRAVASTVANLSGTDAVGAADRTQPVSPSACPHLSTCTRRTTTRSPGLTLGGRLSRPTMPKSRPRPKGRSYSSRGPHSGR